MAKTLSPVHQGVNEGGTEEFVYSQNESVADAADISIQLPDRFKGADMAPVAISGINVASGSSKANQVLTLLNDDDGAGTGVTLKSYNQATGVLLITNNMGTAMTRFLIFFKMVQVPFVPAP